MVRHATTKKKCQARRSSQNAKKPRSVSLCKPLLRTTRKTKPSAKAAAVTSLQRASARLPRVSVPPATTAKSTTTPLTKKKEQHLCENQPVLVSREHEGADSTIPSSDKSASFCGRQRHLFRLGLPLEAALLKRLLRCLPAEGIDGSASGSSTAAHGTAPMVHTVPCSDWQAFSLLFPSYHNGEYYAEPHGFLQHCRCSDAHYTWCEAAPLIPVEVKLAQGSVEEPGSTTPLTAPSSMRNSPCKRLCAVVMNDWELPPSPAHGGKMREHHLPLAASPLSWDSPQRSLFHSCYAQIRLACETAICRAISPSPSSTLHVFSTALSPEMREVLLSLLLHPITEVLAVHVTSRLSCDDTSGTDTMATGSSTLALGVPDAAHCCITITHLLQNWWKALRHRAGMQTDLVSKSSGSDSIAGLSECWEGLDACRTAARSREAAVAAQVVTMLCSLACRASCCKSSALLSSSAPRLRTAKLQPPRRGASPPTSSMPEIVQLFLAEVVVASAGAIMGILQKYRRKVDRAPAPSPIASTDGCHCISRPQSPMEDKENTEAERQGWTDYMDCMNTLMLLLLCDREQQRQEIMAREAQRHALAASCTPTA